MKYNPSNEIRISQTPVGRDLERAESQGKSAQQIIDETPSAGFSVEEYINALNARKAKMAKVSKPTAIKTKKNIKAKLTPFSSSGIGRFLIKSKLPKRSAADRIKVLSFANRLEKLKLQNQINRLKLQRRMQIMQGKLPILRSPTMLIRRPVVYSDNPIINQDVSSAFNADIGTGENLFGSENFFGSEAYFDEDFYGSEFNTSPETQLGLDFNRRGSPFFI